MDDDSSLYGWLESAGLNRFYKRFQQAGINESNFTSLQFHDYDALGIVGNSDRQTLFKLIQVVKKASNNPSSVSSAGTKKKEKKARPRTGLMKPKQYNTKELLADDENVGPSKTSSSKKHHNSNNNANDGNNNNGSHRKKQSPLPDAIPVPLNAEDVKLPESKIRVCVRKRPLSRREVEKGEKDVISFGRNANDVVYVSEVKQKVDLTKFVEKHQFIFDEAFTERATNEEIYEHTCRPLVSFFFQRGKATCFAYGQTGSGKTHTMMGPGGGKGEQVGLYALAARDIFATLPHAKPSNLQLFASFFEIYGGKLYDLLDNRKKLACREDAKNNVHVVGIKECRVMNVDDLLMLMESGNGVRSTGSTGANADSSRSHAILQLKLMVPDRVHKKKFKTHGKFSFIDLAGSERGADTRQSDRQTRIEGAEINRSLLALKECIRALDQQAHHQPFRGSKLTQVLKDSFIGNSRTVMIGNISPNGSATEHTLNTLRYADRVKELRGGKKKRTDFDAYMPHAGPRANVVSRNIDSVEDYEEEEAYENSLLDEENSRNSPAPRSSPTPQNNNDEKRKRKKGTKKKKARSSNVNDMAPPPAADRRESLVYPDENEAKEQQEDLLRTHEQLCTAILEEEDEIVEAHRAQIDNTMQLVKDEMHLLKKFDQMAFSVDEYIMNLDRILANKIKSISSLREKISVFHQHLKEEEMLSNSLKESNTFGTLTLVPDELL